MRRERGQPRPGATSLGLPWGPGVALLALSPALLCLALGASGVAQGPPWAFLAALGFGTAALLALHRGGPGRRPARPASAAFWERAHRKAGVGHWEIPPAGEEVRASPALHALLGGPEERLSIGLGRLLSMVDPDDRDRVAAAVARMRDGGPEQEVECRVTGLDGRPRVVRITGAGHLGPGGAAGLWQDVTGLRAAEAALRESAEHFRHTVELGHLIPWTESAEGMAEEVSPRWLELTGMSREESLGDGWTRAIHPDDLAAATPRWREALRTGEPYELEYRVRTAGGEERWFRARAVARRDTQGRVLRWYGTSEDIHDRRLAEEALRRSEAFASSILESTEDVVEVVDLHHRLCFMNGAGRRLMGAYGFEPGIGRPWIELWPEATGPKVREALATASAGAVARFASIGPVVAGKPTFWDSTVSPILGSDGHPERLLCISRDITALQEAQDSAERARQDAEVAARRLRDVLESTTDCVVILDRDRRVQFINRRAQDLLAQPAGAGTGGAPDFPGVLGPALGARIEEAVMEGHPAHLEEHLPDLGLWLEIHAYPSREGLSLFFRDVGDRRRALERLEFTARHDGLTDLLNRSAFRQSLERALLRAEGGGGRGTGLLFLDLDEFKSVNDSLGHPAGDELLAQAGARLRACARTGDPIARFGGDEFAVLQEETLGAEPLERLAHRVIQSLSEPYRLQGREVQVGASVGIAFAAPGEGGADDLLKKADIALYRAKAEGKGTARLFEPGMGEAVEAAQALRGDLRDALARGEFVLRFQPIVDFEAGRASAFEALLRWYHPRRGLVPPAEFIPLAEETGAIAPIGAWVLREACAAAAGWPGEVSVSVNLSSRQFRGDRLLSDVREALEESGLPPSRLILEITESVLLQDDEHVRRLLGSFRAQGIRVSIDDFGTGFSSLGYLRRFAVDNIKIDRSFVGDLSDNPRASAVLRAVVSLARELGMTLTAEGVESQAQMQRLRVMGCRQGQGHLFGRPVAAEAVAEAIMAAGPVRSHLS